MTFAGQVGTALDLMQPQQDSLHILGVPGTMLGGWETELLHRPHALGKVSNRRPNPRPWAQPYGLSSLDSGDGHTWVGNKKKTLFYLPSLDNSAQRFGLEAIFVVMDLPSPIRAREGPRGVRWPAACGVRRGNAWKGN